MVVYKDCKLFTSMRRSLLNRSLRPRDEIKVVHRFRNSQIIISLQAFNKKKQKMAEIVSYNEDLSSKTHNIVQVSKMWQKFAFLVPLVVMINLYFRRSFSFAGNRNQILGCFVIFVSGLLPDLERLVNVQNCKSC